MGERRGGDQGEKLCALCGCTLTRVTFGRLHQPFWVHLDAEAVELCVAAGGPVIVDDQRWLTRILYILEKLGKRPRGLTQHIVNQAGQRAIFGEQLDE